MYCNTRTLLDPASVPKRGTCYQLFVFRSSNLCLTPWVTWVDRTRPPSVRAFCWKDFRTEAFPLTTDHPPQSCQQHKPSFSASASGFVFCPTRLRLPGTFHRPEWMSRYCEVALSRPWIPTQMFVVVQNST